MIQEGRHLKGTDVLRVAFAGKKDKSLDPVDVGLLGAVAVVLTANGVAHQVEQPPRLCLARFTFRLIPLHIRRTVLTTGGVDMALLQLGGTHSACFHN